MAEPHTILVVTARQQQLHAFIEDLGRSSGWKVTVAGSETEAMDVLGRISPLLVVVDETVGAVGALDLVRRLLAVNAFVHTAVISDRGDAEFHEWSEGLGILARVPINPDRQEAARLLKRLEQVTGDHTY